MSDTEIEGLDLRPFEQELATRAADARGRLSRNDELILAYLQRDPDELHFHTSDSLAQKVAVSRAAIVRFATKLGFSGFTELQQASRAAFRASQESPLSRFAGSQGGSVIELKAAQDSRNVLATEALIRDAVGPAAKVVADAERVYLLAARRSIGLMMHLEGMLAGVRDGVHVIDPGFPDRVTDVKRDDVVIACLFRRYSRQTVELLEVVRRSGAAIALVTDGKGHDFAAPSDHVIVAAATTPTLYDSMVAPTFAIECLIAEVAAVNPRRSRKRLEAIEDFTDRHRLLLG